MTRALDSPHDVIHKTHAVFRPSIKGSHLPVIETGPRAGDGMSCLPQTDLQEGVPTCSKRSWLCKLLCVRYACVSHYSPRASAGMPCP